MATDSTTAGYLAPLAPDPKYDEALENIFHGLLHGITGIPKTLIRPRWQPDPPNQPDFQTNWVAFGVTIMQSDWDPYLLHEPEAAAGAGISSQSQGETLHIMLSFYGPNYQAYERRFRHGIHIEQNRDALTVEKIKFIELTEPVTLPALLKEKWVKRIDSKMVCRRWVSRTYPIRHFVEASGEIDTDASVSNPPLPFVVNP